jgi:hypothetical protein
MLTLVRINFMLLNTGINVGFHLQSRGTLLVCFDWREQGMKSYNKFVHSLIQLGAILCNFTRISLVSEETSDGLARRSSLGEFV